MIAYVAKAVNLLASLIQQCVFITSSIGQVIVIVIGTATGLIIKSIATVLKFFQIVYEDNVSIFTEDLPHLSSKIFEAIYHQWLYLHGILMGVCNETINRWNLLINSIKWSLSTVFIVFSEVFYMVKKFVIVLGDTLWFVLTFVPVHLPYLVKHVKDIIINYLIEAYMALLKVTDFLSADVPLETFIGIISAVIIISCCIYFKEAIKSQATDFYWFLMRKFLYLYHMMYNYFTNSDVRLVTQIVGDQEPLRYMGDHIENDDEDSVAAFCVICQEMPKCVLTLPCRHVCLCTECCVRLCQYQRKCPICRTFIFHALTIYL